MNFWLYLSFPARNVFDITEQARLFIPCVCLRYCRIQNFSCGDMQRVLSRACADYIDGQKTVCEAPIPWQQDDVYMGWDDARQIFEIKKQTNNKLCMSFKNRIQIS